MPARIGSHLLLILSLLNGCHLATFGGQVTVQTKRQRAQQHFERAESYRDSDDPRAEEEYKQAITTRSGVYPEAWEGLSQHLWRSVRFEEAVDAWQKYLEQSTSKISLEDKNLLKRLKRAAILKSQSDKGDTLSLAECLELTDLVLGFGSEAQALSYAEKTVELYPESSKALIKLAKLIDSKQKDRARVLFTRAIEFEPREPANYVARGQFHFWVDGNVMQAAEDFRKGIELSDGANASAWYGRGMSLARLGRHDEAIAALEKCLSVRPKSFAHFDEQIKRSIKDIKDFSSKP